MAAKYSYLVSRKFVQKWSKLNSKTKKKTTEKIDIFLRNPYMTALKTHKLSGKLQEYWSFSIDYHLRIMFRFIDKQTVEFIDIGTHEIYK